MRCGFAFDHDGGSLDLRSTAAGRGTGGQQRAFEELVWPHLRSAYNYARWLSRNSHDAEDIVQESFARALQHLHSLRGRDSRVWLMSIVRNTAINFLRRERSPSTSSLKDADDHADLAATAEQELIDAHRREQVRSAIRELPSDFRETLVLREIEGLSYKEIAAVLDIPLGTVMSRLSRARALLLEALRPEKETRHDLL